MKTFIHGSNHEILIVNKYAHKSLFRAMLMFTTQIKAGVQEANALSKGAMESPLCTMSQL